ncbi:hypothetical protein V8J88_18635 [Massilia sp. W12]|uniref:hypothetical protein n=1 Tax=Massilia sp. W12 TaxID=3126507 RepID=UPI0030D08550
MDYRSKSYGRNQEVQEIFALFEQARDLSMPGPRRLGKTFVLDRLEEQAQGRKWHCIKLDVSGCNDAQQFFHSLCQNTDRLRGHKRGAFDTLVQRFKQLYQPKPGAQSSSWFASLLMHDWRQHLETLLQNMHEAKTERWALLIDELPIFLKRLHDKGPQGLSEARDFMNFINDLRQRYPRVRWLITGSIGMEPLARAGQYFGALAKFHTYALNELSEAQAVDFVQDLARHNKIKRSEISAGEAQALVQACGWRAAYYLDLFASQMPGISSDDAAQIAQHIAACRHTLMQKHMTSHWSIWEEHLRKHDPECKRAFTCLNALAAHENGMLADTLLANINDPALQKPTLLQHLHSMCCDGLLYESAPERFAIRLPLQRLYWQKFPLV